MHFLHAISCNGLSSLSSFDVRLILILLILLHTRAGDQAIANPLAVQDNKATQRVPKIYSCKHTLRICDSNVREYRHTLETSRLWVISLLVKSIYTIQKSNQQSPQLIREKSKDYLIFIEGLSTSRIKILILCGLRSCRKDILVQKRNLCLHHLCRSGPKKVLLLDTENKGTAVHYFANYEYLLLEMA